MSIVNFAIPQTLDLRIKNIIKTKGFSSKAELFRFALIRYLDNEAQPVLENNTTVADLTDRLDQVLAEKIGNKKLPNLNEQFKRLKNL